MNEAIAFNINAYIVFRSLQNDQELYYRADLTNGDGIAVIAGHKNFPIFAFAEKCWNAKIFIISYPDFNKISTFESKEECIYIGLAFSETEHLVALTGMPNYKLQVWFWRTHDMLISKETEIFTDKQKITCSNSLPLTVAQFAYKKAELIVWEIHGSQKLLKLIKRKIDLNFNKIHGPFTDVYTIEGNLLIANQLGEVFYVAPTTSSVNLVVKQVGGEGNTCISYLRNGALLATNGRLRYFKRQKFVWTQIVEIPMNQNFISLRGFLENEGAIGAANDGALHKITLSAEGEKLNVSKLCQYSPFYTDFLLIYPHGEVLVVVDTTDTITVIDIKSGENLSQVLKNETNMREIVIEANPCYPFIAIGNSAGNVYCVQLIDPRNPTLLTEFLLSRVAIKYLKFSNFGHYLIAIDIESNFFIISTTPGSKNTVLHHFKRELFIGDLFSIESRNELMIVFLVKESDSKCDKILKINLKLDDLDANMEEEEFELISSYGTILSFNHSSYKIFGIRERCRFIEVRKN